MKSPAGAGLLHTGSTSALVLLDVAEQLLGEAYALFRGLFDAFRLEFFQSRLDGVAAVHQAAVVGDLDPGPGGR